MRRSWGIATFVTAVAIVGTVMPASPAMAVGPAACIVRNLALGTTHTTLAGALSAARSGDSLTLRGVCAGGVSTGKSIALRGIRPAGAVAPAIAGPSDDPLLRVTAGGNLRLATITVRGGRSDSDAAGIAVAVGARAVLTSVIVRANESGLGAGGIDVDGTLLIRGRSRVSGNVSGFTVGGIRGNSARIVIGGRTRVSGNAGSGGGGIRSDGPGAQLRVTGRTVIAGNESSGPGGGITVSAGTLVVAGEARIQGNRAETGGGIALFGDAVATLTGTAIVGENVADGRGGGIAAGSLPGDAHDLVLDRAVSVVANEAPEGGGISIIGGEISLEGDATITGNGASTAGGGILAREVESFRIVGNAVVSANESEGTGGGIHLDASPLAIGAFAEVRRNRALGSGGGIHAENGSAILVLGSARIRQNQAGVPGGGGILLADSFVSYQETCAIHVRLNTPDQVRELGAGIVPC